LDTPIKELINLSETEKDSIGQIHAMFLRWKTIKTRGLNHILYKRHRVASKMTPRFFCLLCNSKATPSKSIKNSIVQLMVRAEEHDFSFRATDTENC